MCSYISDRTEGRVALKILIVEDDGPTLELMEEVLSSLKAEVRALSDSRKDESKGLQARAG
jgi:CheY-like chemotaxis protein